MDLIPGAGKTILMARLAHALLAANVTTRVVVCVPTDYLRTQVARDFSGFGIALTDEFKAASRVLPAHLDGAVVTYAQVAAAPDAFRRLAQGAFVALDEVHHVGAHATWGSAVQRAFETARFRLLLTGTAFRTDDGIIPFVHYHIGEAQPIYRYSYVDGLADGIVRPAQFEVIGAAVKWRSSDGTERHRLTRDHVSLQEASERLRAVVSSREWFRKAFAMASTRLEEVRQAGHRHAGGLIGAMDVAHAKSMAKWLESDFGVAPIVVTSDDPQSLEKIDRFRTSRDEWLVAVRQVSEGVNVPRLRTIIWATTITSKLFFWQFVGRALRVEAGAPPDQDAYIVLPEDPDLVMHAQTMQQAVRLWGWGTRQRPQSEGSGGGGPESQFGVLSTESYSVGRVLPSAAAAHDDDLEVQQVLGRVAEVVATASSPLEELRKQRAEVNRLVRDFARSSGATHASIHATLNRRCGGSRLESATPEMIARRVVLLRRALETGRLGL